MADPIPTVSLIVPVRDGVEFLPATLRAIADFLRRHPRADAVVVDDGSETLVAEMLSSFAATTPQLTLLVNRPNLGKGAAVARGMLAARGAIRIFTDADLAYPLDQVAVIIEALERGADVAVACRVLPESRYLMSPSFFHYLYTRHLLSRAYNALIRFTLLPGILDSQAGLKGFTASAAGAVFSRLTIPRFGFDVEALFIARKLGFRTVQVPVHFRYDNEPSTVHLARDGQALLSDLVRVWWNDVRGRYR